jgi:hypothetical protein
VVTSGETVNECAKALKEAGAREVWVASFARAGVGHGFMKGGKNVMQKKRNAPEMLEEYDFSAGVRGKYAKRYAEGTNVVVIDPDVAAFFPDHDSVNEALRSLVPIIQRARKTKSKSRPHCPRMSA